MLGLAGWLLASGVAGSPLPSLEPTHDNDLFPIFGMERYMGNLEEDIHEAKKSVYIDLWCLGGESGLRIARHLARKTKQGIDVRVMLDPGLGVLPALKVEGKQVLEYLQAEQVPMRTPRTRPAGWIIRTHTEDHNKLSVIDGKVAYVGGTNIADRFKAYNDLQIRCRGPVVGQLEQQFLHDWEVAGKPAREPLPSDLRYTGTGMLAYGSTKKQLATVRLVGTGIGRLTYHDALINLLKSARSSIRVQVHQLGHDPVLDEIIAAKDRGVDVQVLLDPTNIDNFVPLFGRGPRGIFNAYAVKRLQEAGVAVRFLEVDPDHSAYHMKLGIFDDEWVFVGTANWTHLESETNTETNLELAGGRLPKILRDSFDKLWIEATVEPEVGYLARLINYLYRKFY